MVLKLTPQQYADKWGNRLAGSATEITNGVNSVTDNPMTKAVAQQAKMKQNWNAAIDSGKWAQNTGNVTLAQWKDAMINKGVNRITAGATAGKPKFAAYMTEAIPVMNNLITTIEAMPKMNIQDSINRAAAWMQGMKAFGDSR